MKKAKFLKVLSVSAVAAMMAAAMIPTTAFAAGETATITLNAVTNTKSDKKGSTSTEKISTNYKIYKVFDANFEVTDAFKTVSVVFKKDDGTNETVTLNDNTAADKIAQLCNSGTYKNHNVRALADALAAGVGNLTPDVTKDAVKDTAETVTLDKYCYYLIVPTASAQMTVAPTLLTVTEDTSITPKTSSITVDKAIESVNSGSTTVSTSKNSATVGKNDTVGYSITTQIPAYAQGVEELAQDFKITDTPSAGIAINFDKVENDNDEFDGIVVKVDDTQVAKENNYTIAKTSDNGFVVTFSDAYVLANAGKEVKITFDATVAENAVVTNVGNPNEAQISFDNDYTTGNAAQPTTDDDTVKVYTVNMNLIKKFMDGITDQGNVAGAKFTLYKDYTDESKRTEIGTFETTATSNSKVFEELAEGTYTLVETEAPAGYRKVDPVTFTVGSTKNNDGEYNGTYTFTDNTYTINFAHVDTTNVWNGTVTNNKGNELPGTGGMGTTIFTIAGLGVIVIAGAMLTIYIKKRKADEE